MFDEPTKAQIPEQSPRALRDHLEDLSLNIERLHKYVAELHEKLEPVMRPLTDQEVDLPKVASISGPNSPVVDDLATLTARVYDVSQRIGNITRATQL